MVMDVGVDFRALGRLKPLSWLSQDQIRRLAEEARLIRTIRGEPIFTGGEEAKRIFVMLSGAAKLRLENEGQRVLVGLLGPGEVFGLTALLGQPTHVFKCEAFSDCASAALAPETFIDIVLGVPLERAKHVLDMTMGRWWGMVVRYSSFIGLGLRERLAGALLEIASKFGVQDARGMLLTLRLTHSDLAELVGASRQRTTEQLSEFEREHAILRDGRRLIVVPERMAAMSQLTHFDSPRNTVVEHASK
jgi:CRP-like cAMP-binding protein